MSDALLSIPTDSRRLRACLLCSLVKTSLQFRKDGCENCEVLLRIRGSADRVAECTTSQFHGLIAMLKPGQSWVSRWQRLPESIVQGMYAISVIGSLPDDVIRMLEKKGITHR